METEFWKAKRFYFSQPEMETVVDSPLPYSPNIDSPTNRDWSIFICSQVNKKANIYLLKVQRVTVSAACYSFFLS